MTTLEEIETVLPRLTTPELARLEALAGELRRVRPAPAGDAPRWTLPVADGGSLKVSPEMLTEAADHPVPVTRDDQTVAFLITPERLETLEILADPEAMAAIREAREGRGTYYSLEEFERLLGDED